jgi:peptidyl-prolyl cis-trans isomerase C
MRVGRTLLGLGMGAVVALTGCAKREDAKLAEFKGHVITVGDFEDAYKKVDAQYLPKKTGQEGFREFLDTMLNREVMAAKADELGYDKDPAIAQGMDAFSRVTLQVAFLKKQVADKIKVSDEEVRRHYDNQGVVLSIKEILTDTEDQARQAYDALQKGLDFESAVRQFSKSDDAQAGGTVLTAAYGGLIPEIQDPLFATPVGKYTEPLLTEHGWVIIKVLDRHEGRKPKPFEEIKDQMYTEVHRAKETVAMDQYTEKLRADYGVTWNYDNMMIAFNALPPDRPYEEAPPRSEEIYPLLYFDPADLNKPLVTYQGKSITIKDFSDLYDQASFFARPRRQFRLGGIRGFLTMPIMNEISVDVVRKSGIENDPDVAKVLKRKKEELMTSLMYDDMIAKKTVVTLQEMQNYYNDNMENFRVPEKRKFVMILAGDVASARAAADELRRGAAPATVATAYSIDEDTRTNGGLTKDLAKGENPEIDDVGFGLRKVGDVSEPFQTSRGWMVLKLMERQDAKVFSFDDAKSRIEAALKDKANDKRLKELLAKWKDEFKVVIHEDNLKKIHVQERSAAEPTPKAVAQNQG